MKHKPFRPIAGVSALLSGLLGLAIAALALAREFSVGVPFGAISSLMIIGDILMALVLTAAYMDCRSELPRIGAWGFGLATAGVLLAIVIPLVGNAIYLLGLLLFALALTPAQPDRSSAYWIWLCGAAIGFAGDALWNSWMFASGMFISAGARIWLGAIFLQLAIHDTEEDQRVESPSRKARRPGRLPGLPSSGPVARRNDDRLYQRQRTSR